MYRTRLAAFLLMPVLTFSALAEAQEKNELAGIIGRTFVSDQGVIGVAAPDTNLHSGRGATFEADYGHRLKNLALAGITFEVPLVINFDQDVHFDLNLAPKGYSAFFLTPSLRADLFPDSGISPWISAGGGLGHFSEDSTLEFGGANPGKTGTTSAVLQVGAGLDVRLFRSLDVRAEVRDFFSGVPQLNLDTGKSRQHNYCVGAGLVWHF